MREHVVYVIINMSCAEYTCSLRHYKHVMR